MCFQENHKLVSPATCSKMVSNWPKLADFSRAISIKLCTAFQLLKRAPSGYCWKTSTPVSPATLLKKVKNRP